MSRRRLSKGLRRQDQNSTVRAVGRRLPGAESGHGVGPSIPEDWWEARACPWQQTRHQGERLITSVTGTSLTRVRRDRRRLRTSPESSCAPLAWCPRSTPPGTSKSGEISPAGRFPYLLEYLGDHSPILSQTAEIAILAVSVGNCFFWATSGYNQGR